MLTMVGVEKGEEEPKKDNSQRPSLALSLPLSPYQQKNIPARTARSKNPHILLNRKENAE